jgi:hypothetical protein
MVSPSHHNLEMAVRSILLVALQDTTKRWMQMNIGKIDMASRCISVQHTLLASPLTLRSSGSRHYSVQVVFHRLIVFLHRMVLFGSPFFTSRDDEKVTKSTRQGALVGQSIVLLSSRNISAPGTKGHRLGSAAGGSVRCGTNLPPPPTMNSFCLVWL